MAKTSEYGVVINHGDHEEAKPSVWSSMASFHRAPCLAQSLGLGGAGGAALGLLRLVSGSSGKAAGLWGATAAGLLAGTSWFTCRRAMYASRQSELDLLQRVAAREPEALAAYEAKLEAARRREGGERP